MDWVEAIDNESGATYWHNTVTGDTSWDAPLGAPPVTAWVEVIPEDGSATYWHNTVTDETSWAEPRRVSSSRAAGLRGSARFKRAAKQLMSSRRLSGSAAVNGAVAVPARPRSLKVPARPRRCSQKGAVTVPARPRSLAVRRGKAPSFATLDDSARRIASRSDAAPAETRNETFARGLYDCTRDPDEEEAAVVDELEFQDGALLEVVGAVVEREGWLLARNARGRLGLVPSNYVDVEAASPVPQTYWESATFYARGNAAAAQLSEGEISLLWACMLSPSAGVMKSSWRTDAGAEEKKLQRTFSGSAAMTWLRRWWSDPCALALGAQMQSAGLFKHIAGAFGFVDDDVTYTVCTDGAEAQALREAQRKAASFRRRGGDRGAPPTPPSRAGRSRRVSTASVVRAAHTLSRGSVAVPLSQRPRSVGRDLLHAAHAYGVSPRATLNPLEQARMAGKLVVSQGQLQAMS